VILSVGMNPSPATENVHIVMEPGIYQTLLPLLCPWKKTNVSAKCAGGAEFARHALAKVTSNLEGPKQIHPNKLYLDSYIQRPVISVENKLFLIRFKRYHGELRNMLLIILEQVSFV